METNTDKDKDEDMNEDEDDENDDEQNKASSSTDNKESANIMIATWNTGNRPLKGGTERHSVDDYINHILDNTDPDAITLLQEIQQWNKLDQQIFETHTHTLSTNTKQNTAY